MKFIKIDYYEREWVGDALGEYRFYKINRSSASRIIAIDSIRSIAARPAECKLYETLERLRDSRWATFEKIELYHIKTDIAVGRGINGISYEEFDVTRETYEKLLTLIDIA